MITNTIRHDGFGAQYQSIISTIVCSELRSVEFIYSKPDFETVYECEADYLRSLLNLENSFRNLSSLSEKEKKIVQPMDIGLSYSIFESNLDLCLKSKSIENIRRLYIEKNKNQYDKTYTNVAIHIRRCSKHKNIDLSSHHDGIDIKNTPVNLLPSLSNRFLPDSYFLNIIKQIKIKPSIKPLKFHIFSEGKDNDFSNFKQPDIQLHLNESVQNTFSNLVHADILVTSPSSFSYTAALLSTNIIYAKSFWHANASHWINC